MRRREFLEFVGGITATWPFAAGAQSPAKVERVGFLRQAGAQAKQLDAFRDGLRAAGYIEGQNIVIEARYADGAYERLSNFVAELIHSNVDVILVDGPAAATACKDATSTIPIVFTLAVDPVAEGLVKSLAHPGGDLTGLTMAAGYELAGKQIELLKDIVGTLSRVAVLGNPANPPHMAYLRETERTAAALGVDLRAFEVSSADDLATAFMAMTSWRATGLVTLPDGLLFNLRERVVQLALTNKLPSVFPEAEFAAAGGLASYGPSLPDLFRQAAGYVAKILKGEKPADLPVEQPSKFDLVINLATAKALGITMPPVLVSIAAEVIE